MNFIDITKISKTASPKELLKRLVPPRQFKDATFSSYFPDNNYHSQISAVAELKKILEIINGRKGAKIFKNFH